MQAKITNPSGFKIAIDGTKVISLKFDEIVSGHVAARAIETGNGVEIGAAEINKKIEQPVEEKPKRGKIRSKLLKGKI